MLIGSRYKLYIDFTVHKRIIKIKINMKTLVLSGLIAIATTGNTFANHLVEPTTYKKELAIAEKNIDEFKLQIAFYQKIIDVLWNQYNLSVVRIHNSKGSLKELEDDRTYFLTIHQQNIQKGTAVEESKKSIIKIERKFKKDVSRREAYEAKEITRLQSLVKKELMLAKSKFEKMKKSNKELVDNSTLPMLQMVDQYLSQSIERIDRFAGDNSLIIASDK